MKKLILFFLLLLPFVFNSCGGDEPNELEKYEGIWNVAITITTNIAGEESIKTESSSQVEITAGDNELIIDGTPYKVVNNTVSVPKSTINSSFGGMTMETTTEATGTLTDNKIEIKQVVNSKTTYPDATVISSTQTINIVLTK